MEVGGEKNKKENKAEEEEEDVHLIVFIRFYARNENIGQKSFKMILLPKAGHVSKMDGERKCIILSDFYFVSQPGAELIVITELRKQSLSYQRMVFHAPTIITTSFAQKT